MSLAAREGRHRQRYEGQLRLVAGCIPYRFDRNIGNQQCDVESQISVLMISTPNRDDLIFPKGGWEDDETAHDAACREAYEEAGVKGIIDKDNLGVWEFRSKSRQNCSNLDGGCRGYMFALEVTEELDSWPEQASYKRKWLNTQEAYKLCRYDWMREALGTLCQALSNNIFNGRTGKSRKLLVSSPSDTLQTEHQIVSSGCLKRTASLQQLEEPGSKYIVQG